MTNQEHYADYKWIKVKRYTIDESKTWEEKYKSLDDHHIKETSFLIEEVRTLAKKLDDTEAAEQKLKNKQESDAAFRSFLVMWFGFGSFIHIAANYIFPTPTWSNWIFAASLAGGGICSYVVWQLTRKKHA